MSVLERMKKLLEARRAKAGGLAAALERNFTSNWKNPAAYHDEQTSRPRPPPSKRVPRASGRSPALLPDGSLKKR